MDNYKYLSELLTHSVISISKISLESTQSFADNIAKMLENLSNVTASYYSNMSDQLTEVATHLSELCQSLISSIEIPTISSESFEFLKNIDFQDECIELNEDACDSINTILEFSENPDVTAKVSKGQLTLADFITILIAILAIVLPMIQTSYYHKIDTIESQKVYIEELQQKEKELSIREKELRIAEQQLKNDMEQKEILENILTEIQSFSEYVESLQEAPEYPDEVPEPFDEDPHSLGDNQDNDLSNPDVPKSSRTAINRE